MSGIRRTAADREFSKEIRLRAFGRCERCGSRPAPSGLHCAHHFTRRCSRCTARPSKPHKCTRLDPDNALALCYGCHQYLDAHPVEKEAFWRSIIGDERFDALAARAHGKRDRTARRDAEVTSS
jgi:hypothetical protein